MIIAGLFGLVSAVAYASDCKVSAEINGVNFDQAKLAEGRFIATNGNSLYGSLFAHAVLNAAASRSCETSSDVESSHKVLITLTAGESRHAALSGCHKEKVTALIEVISNDGVSRKTSVSNAVYSNCIRANSGKDMAGLDKLTDKIQFALTSIL